MIIERMPEPMDVIVIRDTFDDTVLEDVTNEIAFVTKNDQGAGIWLNEFYKDVDSSAIHNAVMNTYFDQEIAGSIQSVNPMYGLYSHVNNHSVQCRHLGHGQESMLHVDVCAFTVSTFIHREPKSFDGGNVTVQIGGDVAYEQNINNNMTVIYPSCYYVGLSKVKVSDPEVKDSGLFVINTFLFIESR